MSVHSADASQVGGSIAGLMVARALRGRGLNVRILEASTESDLNSPFGLSLGENVQDFLKQHASLNMPPFIENSGRIKVGLDGRIISSTPLPNIAKKICTGTWNGLRNSLCASIDARARYSGSVELVYEAHVTDVSQEKNKMAVEYTEKKTGKTRKELADIVIAADGPYSTVRRCVEKMPCTNVERQSSSIDELLDEKRSGPQYKDYVAWRGRLKHDSPPPSLAGASIGTLAETLAELRAGKIGTLDLPEGSYILLYALPYSNCASY